jgi:hypothetical protein
MRVASLNRAQVKDIVQRSAKGQPRADIALTFRVSKKTIDKVLTGHYRAREDGPRVHRVIPLETKSEIHRRAQGLNYAQMEALAAEYDVAATTVQSYAKQDPALRPRRTRYCAPRTKALPIANMSLPRHRCEPYGTTQSIGSCVARFESVSRHGAGYVSACRGCKEGTANQRKLRELGVSTNGR